MPPRTPPGEIATQTPAPGPAGRSASSTVPLDRILDINHRLAAEHQTDRLLHVILDLAIEMSGAERGFILLGKQDGEEILVARNVDRETIRKPEFKVSRTIVRKVIQAGRTVLTHDAMGEKDLEDSESVHEMRLRSILCAPIVSPAEVLGALYLDNRFRAGAFDPSTSAPLVEALGDQAGIALANARFREEAARSAEGLARANNELQDSHRTIDELNARLSRQLEEKSSRLDEVTRILEEREAAESFRHDYSPIWAVSPAMHALFRILDRVTASSAPVLVQGECGTGKELVARAIHGNGPRRSRPMVSLNCAAVPAELHETELFGHEKGAFTGAAYDKKGLFEVADGGTLFLDEVGDMSLSMQGKLLRALQEGEVRRVGGSRTLKVDVRVVSATNRSLRDLVDEGLFRKDLYYRLNVVMVVVPALRDRKEDIPVLAHHFLGRFGAGAPDVPTRIEEGAIELLMRYPWPGNVRELEAAVQTAALFATGGSLTAESFERKPEIAEWLRRERDVAHPDPARGPFRFEADRGRPWRVVEEAAKRAYLAETLASCGGNVTRAAEVLGFQREHLSRILKQLKIR